MSIFEKWVDRVYAEVDFGRSLATSLAGAAGSDIYLKTSDWVIAAFCSIIFFPIARITATTLHGSFVSGIQCRQKEQEIRLQWDPNDERAIMESVFWKWHEMLKSELIDAETALRLHGENQ